MNIGLDLSVIQTPHRMRGIGATAINFINSMPKEVKQAHTFVLFLEKDGETEALSLLKLEGLTYEVRYLSKAKLVRLPLPRKLRLITSALNVALKLYEGRIGDPRITEISDLDAYLQFDQMQALPRRNRKVKFGIIMYDLIPYVMETEYLWNYWTARERGCSRKGAIRKALLRRRYIHQVQLAGKRADLLFAISEYTKHDLVKYAGIPAKKIIVTHLGIDQSLPAKAKTDVHFSREIENSWGHFPQKTVLDDKPFLLFLGGADPRRKLIDLFAAYNNLKAQGYDIRLVLAGDTMQGPKSLPTAELQKYVSGDSYNDDIYFLGFVSDEQREWLYNNALALVYPSVYEGFGLPILEAMRYGTPVITYKNTSIEEVAGDAALFAHDSNTIKMAVDRLMSDSSMRKAMQTAGKRQAQAFAWSDTVNKIVKRLAS